MDHGRRAAIVAIALACGCFVASPVVRFGGGKSPEQAQHQVLGELIPPQLAMEPRWTGDVRTLKIRVWADDDHRAQNVHWQRVFGEQLDYANAVLAASFGIRLEAEYRSWSHHAPGGSLCRPR